jgi:protein TonB
VAAQGRGGASERPASPAPTGAGLAGADPGVDRPAVPDRPAAYLSNPRPRYPELARRRGLEGLVVLEVLVDLAGAPERVTVNRSSGHEVLDSGAVEAVKRWRFAPARREGQAVAARVQVPVRFALTDH